MLRVAFFSMLMACCAALHAGLEPFDEGLLLRYTSGDAILPGVMPVGFEHVFEPGDLQEVEVLDRGVYRTLRFHIVAKLDDKVICEVHNGRGLVFAGLMDKNGTFHKAWAGRSGERPVEIKHRTNFHMQTMLHDALRVPWPVALYNAPAKGYREGETFKLGETTLTVRAAMYECSGVQYECLQSHGADNWFGPYWQWTADGVLLMRVTRREKLSAPQPLMDWSKIAPGTPAPIDPPAWDAPAGEWTVQQRADGSTLVFSYNANGEYQFLDRDLNTVSGAERISPYGKREVDATSPGPFVVPPGCTLQLQPPIDTDWSELELLLRQAVRMPISMVVATGSVAGDRGLKLLKDLPALQSLDVFLLSETISTAGFQSMATMSKLIELSFTFANEAAYSAIAPLRGLKQVRKLAIRAPDLSAIPEPLLSWTNLQHLEFTGKDPRGVKAFTKLESLWLVHSEISRSSADEVASLSNLRTLELHSTDFPISVLKKMTRIERMAITADVPEDAAFQVEAAAGLKNLRTLDLAIIDMRGQDLLPLAESAVEALSISDGLRDSADVATLAKLKSLRSLTLNKLKGADAAALASLSALTGLKSFTLGSPALARSRTASAELAALAKLTFLEELHVTDCKMAKLGPLGLNKFSKLKHLTLGDLNIEAAVLDELAACTRLESLSLESSLAPKGAAAKLSALKWLKHLDLRDNFSFLPEDLQALRTALPACEIRT